MLLVAVQFPMQLLRQNTFRKVRLTKYCNAKGQLSLVAFSDDGLQPANKRLKTEAVASDNFPSTKAETSEILPSVETENSVSIPSS